MSIRIALPLAALALATVVGAALWGPADPVAPPAAVDPATTAEPQAEHLPEPAPTARAAASARTTWRLRYDFASGASRGGRLTGTWTTRPLADGRVAVRLQDASLTGAPAAMDADALASGAELVPGRDGVTLAALGFPDPQLSAGHRRLYAELASLLWLTEGEGPRWHAVEEGLSGAYLARYRRDGDAVIREVDGLTARRVPGGLVDRGAGRVEYHQRARFTFDAAGLAEVVVELRVAALPGAGRPGARSTGRLTLERVAATPVAARAGVTRPEPIGALLDPAAMRVAADHATLSGADLPTLLAEVEAIDAAGPARDRVRKRLTAMLRIDPAAAEAVADMVRGAPDDVDRAGLLLGALGSAETDAGTDALAGLVDDDTLDARIRRSAIDHISLGQPATPAAADALYDALGGEHDRSAAAALGSQARRLADLDPEAADAMIDTLLARAMEAADDGARVDALDALGNSGSPRALPYLRGLTGSPDPAVSAAAIYALRFMPGGGADALLEAMLGVSDDRKVAAIRAIAFRDPAVWRDRLAATRVEAGSRAASALSRVLGGWM